MSPISPKISYMEKKICHGRGRVSHHGDRHSILQNQSNECMIHSCDGSCMSRVHPDHQRCQVRLQRWSLFLQEYKFDIAHRAGTSHGNAGLPRQSWFDLDPTSTSPRREGGDVVTRPPTTARLSPQDKII